MDPTIVLPQVHGGLAGGIDVDVSAPDGEMLIPFNVILAEHAALPPQAGAAPIGLAAPPDQPEQDSPEALLTHATDQASETVAAEMDPVVLPHEQAVQNDPGGPVFTQPQPDPKAVPEPVLRPAALSSLPHDTRATRLTFDSGAVPKGQTDVVTTPAVVSTKGAVSQLQALASVPLPTLTAAGLAEQPSPSLTPVLRSSALSGSLPPASAAPVQDRLVNMVRIAAAANQPAAISDVGQIEQARPTTDGQPPMHPLITSGDPRNMVADQAPSPITHTKESQLQPNVTSRVQPFASETSAMAPLAGGHDKVIETPNKQTQSVDPPPPQVSLARLERPEAASLMAPHTPPPYLPSFGQAAYMPINGGMPVATSGFRQENLEHALMRDKQPRAEGVWSTAWGGGNTTMAPLAVTPAPGTDQARHIATQLAAAVSTRSDGTTEVRLNPEELGRVRLTLSGGEGTLIVTVVADRPETQDLLRRHLDLLAQEFRQQGYDNPTFQFSDQQADRDHEGADRRESTASTEIEATNIVTLVASDGLDLRL